jgi:hypothetical protein
MPVIQQTLVVLNTPKYMTWRLKYFVYEVQAFTSRRVSSGLTLGGRWGVCQATSALTLEPYGKPCPGKQAKDPSLIASFAAVHKPASSAMSFIDGRSLVPGLTGPLNFLSEQPSGRAIVQVAERGNFTAYGPQRHHNGNTPPSGPASPATSGSSLSDLKSDRVSLAQYLGEIGDQVGGCNDLLPLSCILPTTLKLPRPTWSSAVAKKPGCLSALQVYNSQIFIIAQK